MGPLQPRTASVSITTYIATTVVLVLWLLVAVAVAMYLVLYQRKRTLRMQRTGSNARTIPPFPPGDPTALPSYPQRVQSPSFPPSAPSSLSAMTRPTDLPPIRELPSADSVHSATPPVIKDSGRLPLVSPTRPSFPAAPSTSEATQRALLATHLTQAARLTQLQAMALASDTTDMSAETVEPGKEVVNAGYMTMLAQRGVPLRDHALLGSDDSTDAGGGTGPALGYAVHPRDLSSISGTPDGGRKVGGFTGQGGRGRAATLAQRDEQLERARPLRVRKMSSM